MRPHGARSSQETGGGDSQGFQVLELLQLLRVMPPPLLLPAPLQLLLRGFPRPPRGPGRLVVAPPSGRHRGRRGSGGPAARLRRRPRRHFLRAAPARPAAPPPAVAPRTAGRAWCPRRGRLSPPPTRGLKASVEARGPVAWPAGAVGRSAPPGGGRALRVLVVGTWEPFPSPGSGPRAYPRGLQPWGPGNLGRSSLYPSSGWTDRSCSLRVNRIHAVLEKGRLSVGTLQFSRASDSWLKQCVLYLEKCMC